MLSNIPFFEALKRLTRRRQVVVEEKYPTLYDLFKQSATRHWEVEINYWDQIKINLARQEGKAVMLTPNLSDAQLLKLHTDGYPDYGIKLIYHSTFGIYELIEGNTRYLFEYQPHGLYRPVENLL